jgi:hypothetical protein
MLGQVLLPLGAGDLIDVVQDRLQRPEPLQQLGCGLVADPRDARDVVGGVALQPDEVGHQLGRHAVALDHALAIVDLRVGDPAGGGHDTNTVADHLVDVAIAGDDHHRDVGLPGLLHEACDHVVGLPAFDLHVVEAERLGQGRQVGPLLLEQVGTRRPAGLVLGVLLLPARHSGVPGDDHGRRLVLDEDLGHHRREAVDGVGGPAVGGRDRLRKREERPVGEAVAVDQEQLSVAGGSPLLGGGFRLRRGHPSILGRAAAISPRAPTARPRPA